MLNQIQNKPKETWLCIKIGQAILRTPLLIQFEEVLLKKLLNGVLEVNILMTS